MATREVLLRAREYGESWGIEPLALLKCARDIVINLIDDGGLEAEAIRYTASRLEALIKDLSLTFGKGE